MAILNQSSLSSEEKELLSRIVNSRPFVSVWGRQKRCTYCKNLIMGICAKAMDKFSKSVCDGFCIVDYLDAPNICRLCKYATMRNTCDDKDMQILIPYCMCDKSNPTKVGATSTACNNFKSCLEVNTNEIP